MKYLICIFIWGIILSSNTLLGQAQLQRMNTDFDSEADLTNWQWLHEKQGYPSKLLSASVEIGALVLKPNTSAWYADFQAPFLFQSITGNFDVSARLMVQGNSSPSPTARWSLGGLMVRAANRTTKENWTSRNEDWLFITTGVADPVSIPVFETKTTIGSRSNLKLRPSKSGWVTLRAIRVDNTFLLLYKYDDASWQVLERFYRTDLPQTLQIGLIAYTDFYSAGSLIRNVKKFNETVIDSGSPDMRMMVDFVKATKPNLAALKKMDRADLGALQHWTAGNLLSDYNLTNEQVLNLLGIK